MSQPEQYDVVILGSGAPGKLQGHERERDRAGVGQHVGGVGEQRQRMRDDPRGDLDRHHREHHPERAAQPPAVVPRGGRCVLVGVRMEPVAVGHGTQDTPACSAIRRATCRARCRS